MDDILSVLPPRMAEKARRLMDTTGNQAEVRAYAELRDEALQRKLRAERNVAARRELMRHEGSLKHDELLTSELARAEACKDELKLASADLDRAAKPAQRREDLAASLKDFLSSHRRGLLHGGALPFTDAPIKPEVAADPIAAVEKHRAGYAPFDGEQASAEGAPLDPATVISRVADAVDQIAEKGALTVDPRRRSGDPAKLADALRAAQGPKGSLSGDGGASFFVWLLRDDIVAHLAAMVPEKIAGAMTDDEREAALADIARRRLEHERREEALILGAEARGITILRRPDADPRAVLEISEA